MLPQNAYSGAPVSVHAFNSITMPSGRPVHKGPKVDPNTPDMEVPPFLELSESYEQVRPCTCHLCSPCHFDAGKLARKCRCQNGQPVCGTSMGPSSCLKTQLQMMRCTLGGDVLIGSGWPLQVSRAFCVMLSVSLAGLWWVLSP